MAVVAGDEAAAAGGIYCCLARCLTLDAAVVAGAAPVVAGVAEALAVAAVGAASAEVLVGAAASEAAAREAAGSEDKTFLSALSGS